MPDIIFCLFYILLFSAIIMGNKWFRADGLKHIHLLEIFYLKLLFGVALCYIYTHIYTNRMSSDIFKYYDDARIIFNTLHTSVKDYFTLLTGIGDSGAYYQNIYHSMNNWENGYGSILYTNSHFIIRMNAFFWLFSQGYYGVHVIFMCFISLVGSLCIYKSFLSFLYDKSKLLAMAIFLFPSTILWSSGVLKEGFIWFGLGLSIYCFFRLLKVVREDTYLKAGSKILFCFFILLGFFILFESKAYVLLCILPCFIALFLIKKFVFCKVRPFSTYVGVLLLYIASSFLPSLLLHKTSPLQMLSDKQADFNTTCRGGIYLTKLNDTNQYAVIPITDSANIIPLNSFSDNLLHKKGLQYLSENSFWYNEFKTAHYAPFMLKKGTSYNSYIPGNKDTLHKIATDSTAYAICVFMEPAKSSVYIEPIKPTFISFLKNLLPSLKISMLLPYPWKIHSAMTAIYCVENIFVLLVICIALFFIKLPLQHIEIVLFCLVYCLMMLVLIGLVTPILGGIERYKSVVIPFLFILLLLITDTTKLAVIWKAKK